MQHLKLHEEVRLVNGYLRSVAYDLPRSTFNFLPKDLVNFLLRSDRAPMSAIEKNPLFAEYAEILAEKEIYFTEDRELIDQFAALDLEWKAPFLINNVIIDIGEFDSVLLQKQSQLFRDLNIKHVHYNFLLLPSPENTELLLSYLEGSPVQTATVLIKNADEKLEQFVEQCASAPRVCAVLIAEGIKSTGGFSKEAIFKIRRYNLEAQPKRTISNFTVNMKTFTEAQQHNVYFNNKLYIDAYGNFKNAPDLPQRFGNIKTIKDKEELIQCLSSDAFKEYWTISKDKCEVCNHCEFRYMCNDDRVPKKRTHDHYFYETPCDYNPFISKWKDEEGYAGIEECGITLNGLGSPILNKNKYDAIIKELWD